MEEEEEDELMYEILIFVGNIMQRIRPYDDDHYVELHPDYPESFDEEKRNLPLILNRLEEKKSLSFKELAQQNPGLRRSERPSVRSKDKTQWTMIHSEWFSYSQTFNSVYPLVLTHPTSAMEKLALAVPSIFWRDFWDFAEQSSFPALGQFLCATMVPLLCPRHEQWLACNEALRAKNENSRKGMKDVIIDKDSTGIQSALIATGIIIVPKASALSSRTMQCLPPSRHSGPGYLLFK